MKPIDFTQVQTPAYIIDERLLIKNLEILKNVMDQTGCKILLAQKAFSMFSVYPIIEKYLAGTTASGLFEAKLGHEEMAGEVHVFNPAYREEEFAEILEVSDHIVFNNTKQFHKFKKRVKEYSIENHKHIDMGIRINPEYSEIETDIYNPCFIGSRLGTRLDDLEGADIDGIDGLHFHTMCEQNSDVLKRTLEIIEEKFGKYLYKMKWLNFGGGHHITRDDYDIETLMNCIIHMRDKYDLQIYLEPGEAVALNTGYLITKVLDTAKNGIDLVIVDTSAACHMPDVLEMPYRPEIIGAGNEGEKKYTYRIGGPTCLAGDIIGDYSFDQPLKEGERLIFCDMAIYTMVKNNTFNGINLPSIATYNETDGIKIIKEFGYLDFKNRLS